LFVINKYYKNTRLGFSGEGGYVVKIDHHAVLMKVFKHIFCTNCTYTWCNSKMCFQLYQHFVLVVKSSANWSMTTRNFLAWNNILTFQIVNYKFPSFYVVQLIRSYKIGSYYKVVYERFKKDSKYVDLLQEKIEILNCINEKSLNIRCIS